MKSVRLPLGRSFFSHHCSWLTHYRYYSQQLVQAPAPVEILHTSKQASKEPSTKGSRKEPQYHSKYQLGTVALPTELTNRIEDLLSGFSRKMLRNTAGQLSETLRGRTRLKPGEIKTEADKPPPIIYKINDTLAYCAHRLPGVYACTYRVLHEIQQRRPDWKPRSLLDFGSGPGTAIWSATQIWKKSITNVLAVEPSQAMQEVAGKLLEGFFGIEWKHMLPRDSERFDLVITSYVLSELKDNTERQECLLKLWKKTKEGGILFIVEPGTPIGFSMIKRARQELLESRGIEKATVLAPCPHNRPCPMAENSWCHFNQRMQRIPVQLASKQNASINWEDEKFSYVVFTKGEELVDRAETWERVLTPPKKAKGNIVFPSVCQRDGTIGTHIITKSENRAAYKEARKARWGDGYAFTALQLDTKKRLPLKKRKKAFYLSSLYKAKTNPTQRRNSARRTKSEKKTHPKREETEQKKNEPDEISGNK